jgi:hypothetical protein
MPADASVLTLGSVAKYELREDASTVSIAVTDVSDQHEHLLRAFDDCRERRCSCPTDQYDKLASMRSTGTTTRSRSILSPSPAPGSIHRRSRPVWSTPSARPETPRANVADLPTRRARRHRDPPAGRL